MKIGVLVEVLAATVLVAATSKLVVQAVVDHAWRKTTRGARG